MEQTWNKLCFPAPEQVIVASNDFVRDKKKSPIQFFVIGKIRFAHIGPEGTRDVFKGDAKQQITLEGPFVALFYAKLRNILPLFASPLRKPLDSSKPLIIADEEKKSLDTDNIVPGVGVCCTCLIRYYSYSMNGQKKTGFAYHLLAIKRLTSSSEEDELEVQIP